MKLNVSYRKELLALLVASGFFFGCIVGSQRSAKTLQPGQVALGTGISHLTATEGDDSDPIDLIDANIQVGVAKGVEVGVRHTLDITSENEATFSSFWGDAKFQLNNLANERNKPTFSVGLSKGYVYDEDAAIHITSIPLTVSSDIGPKTTIFAQYRHELMSEDFFPTEGDSFSNPRNVFVVGSEFATTDPAPEKWTPKINVSVGLQNALAGGDFSIESFSINLGLWFESPFSTPQKTE